MQIKQRIDSCLVALEHRRQSVSVFQAKLKNLIESLRSDGMSPGTLSELLKTLESILRDYSEIGTSCHQMVMGLNEIGEHLTHVEEARRKILTGVEAILKNLSHLDRLAKTGLQIGTTSGRNPKRILLVRISPDQKTPSLTDEDGDEDSAGDTVVH